MKAFLDYIPGNSFFHRLNPLSRLILALFICIACFVSDMHGFLAVMILFNLALAAASGILKRGLLLLQGLGKLSILIFLLQLAFIQDGNVLVHLPLGMGITDKGVSTAFLVVFRLTGATMPLALMLSITQMNDLSNALVKKLGIPYPYAFAFTTAMRFIPVFANEMSGIMEAQTARGVEMDTRNIFKKIKLIFPLCVPLLITSVRKIEGSAISAELRGFHLRTKDSCYKDYRFQVRDLCVIMCSILLIFAAVWINGLS